MLAPRQQGDVGERAALCWLVAQGAHVTIPFGHSAHYDLIADFPKYPLNVLADLNALMGYVYLHPNYGSSVVNLNDPSTITGAPVRGSEGEKLGKVDAIYYDDATDAPEWAAVKSGLFGGHVSLVPLAGTREVYGLSLNPPGKLDT